MMVSQWLKDTFLALLRLFDIVSSILFTPVSDLISNIVNIPLPDWAFLDYSLFFLMLDAGLIFYIGFTLIKWVVNLIT